MPTAVKRRGEGHAAGYVETERRCQQQILARHTAKQIGYCKACCEYGCAGMDRTSMIERVIEIESVCHSGIQHGSVWCWQPSLPQYHLALLGTTPAAKEAEEFSDTGRAATSEQAAECVEDVVASGHARASA
jgi:hypothetical protein